MDYIYDVSRFFDLPKPFYFEAGNTAVGGVNTFNYRIDPVEGKLRVKVWYGMLSSDLCEPEALEEFGTDTDGYRGMICWIDERFEEYRDKVNAGEVEGRRTFEDRRGIFEG